MKKRFGFAGIAVVAVAALTVGIVQATAGVSYAAPTYPTSMAATGDSISRAFDVSWSGFLKDHPEDSWSTGSDTAVASEYQRLLTLDPPISGHAYNLAKSGAKMADLDGQVSSAADRKVGYVTVLMGANDVCTSSIATMTPAETLRAQFRQAMSDLTRRDSGVKVFVSSMPDIYQLWSTLHSHLFANLTWRTFHICQSMLGEDNTDAQRRQVLAREQADNAAIAAVCTAEFARWCRWDNYATYNVKFAPSDVSKVDYFHPSLAGQAKLAATTWAASYWAVQPVAGKGN